MTLRPRAWRTLYNVADALRPGSEDGGVPDLEEGLAPVLVDPAASRALSFTLACLEFEARLWISPSRGFSWLARPERRALLSRWERSPFAFRRRAFGRLRDAVQERPTANLSRPGVTDHSRPGA